jgi:hypothetical protein
LPAAAGTAASCRRAGGNIAAAGSLRPGTLTDVRCAGVCAMASQPDGPSPILKQRSENRVVRELKDVALKGCDEHLRVRRACSRTAPRLGLLRFDAATVVWLDSPPCLATDSFRPPHVCVVHNSTPTHARSPSQSVPTVGYSASCGRAASRTRPSTIASQNFQTTPRFAKNCAESTQRSSPRLSSATDQMSRTGRLLSSPQPSS